MEVLFHFCDDWEFSLSEVAHREFSIQAAWGPAPNDREFAIILFDREEARLCPVYAWVEQNDSSIWFVVSPGQGHVFYPQFLSTSSLPWEQKRGSSATEDRKGKKAKTHGKGREVLLNRLEQVGKELEEARHRSSNYAARLTKSKVNRWELAIQLSISLCSHMDGYVLVLYVSLVGPTFQIIW